MKQYRKITWCIIALAFILPVVGMVFPQIVGQQGVAIPLGTVTIAEVGESVTITAESGTWAEYLLEPLLPPQGVTNGFCEGLTRFIMTLQDAGLPTSFPVVWGVFLLITGIVFELLGVCVDLFMWIPRKIKTLLEDRT